MTAFFTGSPRWKSCGNRISWRRDAREHAGPRSRRDVPPGSGGAPAVLAGVRQRAAGHLAKPGRSRAVIHLGAYPERDFGELWIPALFRNWGQARPRVSVRAERDARR